MNPTDAKTTSNNKKSKYGFEGMPSVNRLIALPAPIPVMKIIKLHKAGIVKDLLNAPRIQNNAIVM